MCRIYGFSEATAPTESDGAVASHHAITESTGHR